MHYIDLGLWTAESRTIGEQTYAFYTNEDGEDWYEAVAHNTERPLGFAVVLKPDGTPIFCGDDLDQLNPSLGRVVLFHEFEQTDEARRAVFQKVFNSTTGEFENPPPAPVTEVTRAQALMALYRAGLSTQVATIVANSEYEPVRIWYANAIMWKRSNPYVQAIGYQLNLTDTQIDDLFTTAAAIQE